MVTKKEQIDVIQKFCQDPNFIISMSDEMINSLWNYLISYSKTTEKSNLEAAILNINRRLAEIAAS